MSHDDFENEPIPGLPARPPEGEAILWQGKPEWTAVARRVMHVYLVAGYLALWIGWRVASQLAAGASASTVAASAVMPIVLSAAAVAILLLIAWGVGRTTVYTVTSKRVAMRFGIALPVTFNFPFRAIEAADVRRLGDARGDIALRLGDDSRIAYLVLWPHVRPWRLRLPQPMLRCLPDVDDVAAILARAIAADGPHTMTMTVTKPDEASSPTSRPALIAAE